MSKLTQAQNGQFLLNCCYLNARSLNMVQKFEEIASIILNEDLNIFALSETWLNSPIPSDLFHIPGYCPLFRLDRSDGRRAGDVGLYVSSEFVPKRRLDLEAPDFELMWVEIKINSINLLCGVCCRPPCLNTDMNIRFLNNLQTCFDKIYAKPDTFDILVPNPVPNSVPNSKDRYPLVVLLGDFNTTPPIPRHVAILAVYCIVGWSATTCFK